MTPREYLALKAEWNRAHGIAPPLTAEQRQNLESGKRYILDAQLRAYNKQVEERRKRAEDRGMRLVSKIPERRELVQ